jgi:hypothetical protein
MLAVRAGDTSFNRDLEARIRQIEAAPPVTQEGGTVRVGPMDGDRLYRDISISYDVTVPMETPVQSRSGSGSQTISDLAGPVDVVTGSGSVKLRAIRETCGRPPDRAAWKSTTWRDSSAAPAAAASGRARSAAPSTHAPAVATLPSPRLATPM